MEQFRYLINEIAREDTPGDSGTAISNATLAKYREVLEIYDGAMDKHYAADEIDEDKIKGVRDYISDEPRTIIMIRGIARAIRHKLQNGVAKIELVEAGSGTGLLAAASAAIDPRVEVKAFDFMKARIEASRAFATDMGLARRMGFEQRDLIRQPYEGRTDVLVAEHLTVGLQTEFAAQIPRTFKVDPRFVIPYAVTPALLTGVDFETMPNGERSYIFNKNGFKAHKGEEVVLGNPSHTDKFDVSCNMLLSKGMHPIMVGNDIKWISPTLGEDMTQDLEGFIKNIESEVSKSSYANHLMGAHPLETSSNHKHIVGLYNSSDFARTCGLRVVYSFGHACVYKGPEPEISVSNQFIEVKVEDSANFARNTRDILAAK